MKKYFILPAFLILFLSVQAHATTYVWPTSQYGDNEFKPVDVEYNSTTITTAGLYDLFYYESEPSNDSIPFYNTVGFCVAPDLSVGQGYADFDTITADNFKAAAWMMDNHLPSADTFNKKTGLQLAIWDAMGFVDSGMSISDVDTNTTEDPYEEYTTYMSDFETWLTSNNLSTWSADGYSIVNFIDSDIQDMIVKNPVPEPATMLLFGVGLLGITAIGRKRGFKHKL